MASSGYYPASVLAATSPLTALLVLRTFSAGCSALTGIEAARTGVPAFQMPEAKNAQKSLSTMEVMVAILFLGSIGLIHGLAITPGDHETVLSALARNLVGSGPAFYVVQLTTMVVLAVAANTSFADFPRLAAMLAKDSYLPHQFTGLGDRLVLANGIVLLTSVTAIIIFGFRGDTHALIPLFAVGAFLAFTLSQAGMVLPWRQFRGKSWRIKAALNGLGAAATGTTVVSSASASSFRAHG